jgi:hypothetical protein
MGRTNVTLRLDAELVREAKVLAARRGSSVSRLLAAQVEELVRAERGYQSAERRALARLERGYELRWTPGDRAELHER